MKYVTSINGKEYMIEIVDEHHILVDGTSHFVDFMPVGDQPVYSLLVEGESFEGLVYPAEEGWQVLLHGYQYPARVEDERERRLRAALGSRVSEQGEFLLRAPMPGLVIAVPASEGQHVEKGDVLLVLESMKMQNELKAPRPGTVTRIRVQAGDSVDLKQTLLSVI
jgi:biotin carboxyl carrier protein